MLGSRELHDLRFHGQPIATRTVTTGGSGLESSNDGLYFLHNDHLGSASVMSSSAGAPVVDTTARYLPFGNWRTEPTAELTDRGYTSHKHNNMASDDIGLIYMNARYYVPGVARFASADTIIPNPANPQSYNRYSYVRNNPLNFVDPTGHIDCELLGGGSDSAGCEESQQGSSYCDNNPTECIGGENSGGVQGAAGTNNEEAFLDALLDQDPNLARQLSQSEIDGVWQTFKKRMQSVLDDAYGEDIVEFASDYSGSISGPVGSQQLMAMMYTGIIGVYAIVSAFVPGPDFEFRCSCNSFVGAFMDHHNTINVDVSSNQPYLDQYLFLQEFWRGTAPSVVLFSNVDDDAGYPFHATVMVLPNYNNPTQSIILQVDGSITSSGIFYTTVGGNDHYGTFTTYYLYPK